MNLDKYFNFIVKIIYFFNIFSQNLQGVIKNTNYFSHSFLLIQDMCILVRIGTHATHLF